MQLPKAARTSPSTATGRLKIDRRAASPKRRTAVKAKGRTLQSKNRLGFAADSYAFQIAANLLHRRRAAPSQLATLATLAGILLLKAHVHLLPVHRYFLRRPNTQPDLIGVNANDGHGDLITDHQGLTYSPR
jgi:hypothetical protein